MSVMFYATRDREEAGQRLIRLAKSNQSAMTHRRALAAKYGSLYEGLELGGLVPYGYSTDAAHYFRDDQGRRIPIIRNACHSIIDTWVSKIAAEETPKPAMLTTHGSWGDRRVAKQLEQLVGAEYYEPQGHFATLEELWIHAARIAAAATGAAAVKVTVYPNEPRVSHELHDTLTMFFDYGELTYGSLRTLGEITWFDVDRLCEIYPKHERIIRASIEKPPDEFLIHSDYESGSVTEMVALYEGWRGGNGPDKPGKYCVAVKGGTIDFRDYEYERPPFAWLVPDPHLYGPLGHSMTHHIYESVRRDNWIKARVDTLVSKVCQSMTFVDKTKLIDGPDALDVVEDNIVIDVADPNGSVRHESPQGFNSAHLDVAERHWMDAHNVAGVPEMHTASKAQPGITAAIADRQIAARLHSRFAAAQKRYVQAVAVDNAKLIIQALREARQEHGKFTRLWAGDKFLREVTSDVLDLPDHKYRVRPVAISGRAQSPEGRLQTAFELRQMGILSDDGYAAVTQGGYDLPEELDDRDTQREWLENEINRWCYASDEDFERPDFYRPPLKFMRLEAALTRVVDGFMEAQMEELEDDRLEMFMLFMSDLDALLQQRPPPQAPPQAPQIAPPQLAALPV